MFFGAGKPASKLSLSQCNSMNKSRLNEYCQKANGSTAKYATENRGGFFVSTVTVNGTQYASIESHSNKKDAESDAAYIALQILVEGHSAARSIEDLLGSVDRKKGGMSFFPPSLPTPQAPSHHQQQQPLYTTPFRSIPLGRVSPVPTPLQSQIGSVSQIQPHQSTPLTHVKGPLTTTPNGRCGFPPVSPIVARGRPVTPVSTSPSNGAIATTGPHQDNGRIAPQYNFVSELEEYCLWHQILSPTYTIVEENALLVGRVMVDGVEYGGSSAGHSAFILAKESAALVAIASLGLQALQVQYKGIISWKGDVCKCSWLHAT